jgi:ribosome maturation factor RimP
LLRVTIDRLDGQFITVEDCEKVTRQLQHVLEVEGALYQRLEVSSPGLDRPLKTVADFVRFAGQQVDLTLKLPFQGRKKYRGQLLAHGDGWRLVLLDGTGKPPTGKPPAKGRAKAPAAPDVPPQALDFAFEEVREARLVPVLDFKGRRFAAPETATRAERAVDEVDGGGER